MKIAYCSESFFNNVLKTKLIQEKGDFSFDKDFISYTSNNTKISVNTNTIYNIDFKSSRFLWLGSILNNGILFFALIVLLNQEFIWITLEILLVNIFNIIITSTVKWIKLDYENEKRVSETIYIACINFLGTRVSNKKTKILLKEVQKIISSTLPSVTVP